MSSIEYKELFLKSQKTGKYQVFIFDVVNSKKMDSDKRQVLQLKLLKLITELYQKIKEIEKKTDRTILVFESDFIHFGSDKKLAGFGLKCEPFMIGDMIGFTVYRNSINEEMILKIFNELKNKFNIDTDFHINTGYYETNDYKLGNELLFRGYCIDILANLHKNKYSCLAKKKVRYYLSD